MSYEKTASPMVAVVRRCCLCSWACSGRKRGRRCTETEHIIAELGILFLIFGFVQLWLRANRSALMNSDPAEAGWRINLYEIPVAAAARPGR